MTAMTMPRELDALLAPIDGAAPSGASLRYDPLWNEIRRLREEEDASLPRGVWQRELKRADWDGVIARCTEALATRTKDLQLAAWLTEAWIHRDGIGGGARGLHLVAALCDAFWDDVHPPIDEGDLDARLSPIVWLSTKLPLTLKSAPVTAPTGEDSLPYAWKDFEAGQYLETLARRGGAAAAAAGQSSGMVPQAAFFASVSLTPAPHFVRLLGELEALQAAVHELDAVLEARCGNAAPGVGPLRELANAMHAFVAGVVEERTRSGEWTAAPAAAEGAASRDEAASRITGTIGSRAEAYDRLRDAAGYLMRTEPHSPVPYLVLRAVSWGEMSVAQLFEELLQRNTDLPALFALLGIRR